MSLRQRMRRRLSISRRALRCSTSAAIAALSAVACAPPGSPVPSRVGGFVRVVTPFEVLDAQGVPYGHPFIGGFIAPRPQFVDIDGDGALDLFIHERVDELMFFENVGSLTEPEFVWRTDRWHDLAIGEWSRFVDLDGDGLIDLLSEERFDYVRVYRNDGTPQEPRLVHATDSLRDAQGRPIFADRQNIPALHDLDANGRMDMLLGRIDGTVARYQATAHTDGDGVPRFALVAERFESIEIVGEITPSMHGANSLFLADADRDGRPDLYWGDFFEPGLLLIENRGAPSSPSLRSEPVPVYSGDRAIVTSGFNAPYLADINGDGAPDLFIGVLGGAFNPTLTASDNFHYYRNDNGSFNRVTTRFVNGIDVGTESVPSTGDIDGDGALDLLVGNQIDPAKTSTGRLYWFANVGSPTEPRLELRDTIDLVTSFHYAPAIANLWDDPLPGLVLGTWTDGIHFYRNTGEPGAPRFDLQEELTLQLPRGSNATPALADLNGDGLLDLVTGRSNGELSYFRNVGSTAEPRFELESDPWLNIRVGRRSHPAFTDLTGNGLPDLVIGREEKGAVVYRNVGTRAEPRFEEDPSIQIPLHGYGAPAFADLYGNGRPVLIAGNVSGGLIFLEPPPGRLP